MITQVFGKRAGEAAAKKAVTMSSKAPAAEEIERERERVMQALEYGDGERPASVKEKIHAILYEHAWVLRDEASLSKGLDQLLQLREVKMGLASHSKILNMDWVEALEVPHLLLAAELLLRASLMRKESRGSFSRTDYPKTDEDHWSLNIAFKKNRDASISMYTRKAPQS